MHFTVVCQHNFRSKDEDINLVSVEEFYEEAPKDISKPVSCAYATHIGVFTLLDTETDTETQTDTERDTDKLTQNPMGICVGVFLCAV